MSPACPGRDRPLAVIELGLDRFELCEADVAGPYDVAWGWHEPETTQTLRAIALELGELHEEDDLRAWVERSLGSGRIGLAREPRIHADAVLQTRPLATIESTPAPVRESSRAPKTPQRTWFEVVVVDELGEPVPDLPLQLTLDGGSRVERTDGDGRVRIDDGEGEYASVAFGNVPMLRERLHPRWRTIRTGEWLEAADDRTVLQLRESMPSVSLRAQRPRVISVQPRVVLARLLGMYFDLKKAFLLPSAVPSLRGVKAIYDGNRGAHVLVVGHTDTAGTAAYNRTLSQERAASLRAWLEDDVDAWLAWYGPGIPEGKRWGRHEDELMIAAMPDAIEGMADEDPVRWYQRTRGLAVDGKAGPTTRRMLVAEYMDVDGTTLPSGTECVTHGCGEAFPTIATGDGQRLEANRRVEVFLFEGEIMPAPPGPTSTASSVEYPEWLRRAKETHEFRPGDAVLEPLFVRWPSSTIALLPAATMLRLEGIGIPKQLLPIGCSSPCGSDVEFEFADVLPGEPCSLFASVGDREVCLWCDQIVDRIDPPFEWCGDISVLID